MEIGILGSVEIWHGGDLLAVGPPQQRCVLAMLAVNAGQGVSVERLAEAVWGEEGQDNARALVHGYISRLRKVLRPTGIQIVRRSPGYALDVERDQVDVHRFRQLVAIARTDAEPERIALGLFEALTLWRGDPFAGVAGGLVMDRIRAGLIQERLAVTEEWAERELELGRHREIVGELVPLCAEHPFQEKLAGLLMLALHRCGRQADALRRFDDVRALLAESLGVDPGDELRALHARILRADPTLAHVPPEPAMPQPRVHTPNTLPFDVPDFTGRAAELDRMLDTVRDRGAVITIDGMAGVGKTTLAVRVAHQLTRYYPDAQLFVDLHGFTPAREPVEPATALATLLRSAGVPAAEIPEDPDQRIAVWRGHLANLRTVVVLDNAVDAAQVRQLIPGAAGCVVLVTSRKRLPTLDGAVPLSLEVLDADQAAALFERIAGPTPANQLDAVPELAALCGRLPLALRVAAARLKHRPQWTASDLVARLRSERNRLVELRVDDRDVAAVFGLSYRYLDSAQRRLFRLLGTHPGVDVDAHAAAAISGLPSDQVEQLLEQLLDHHLLDQRDSGRYRLHDLLREHAQALVEADDDQDTARDRLLDYYLTATDRAADVLQPGRRRVPPEVKHTPGSVPSFHDLSAAMAWYTTEHENLVAAAAVAARDKLDRHTVQLPRHVGNYLVIGHHIDELVAIQLPAVEAARRLGDPAAEALSLSHLALTYYMAGRYRPGLDYARRTLELAQSRANPAEEGYALIIFSLLLQRLGRYAEADDCSAAAIKLREGSDDHRLVAICMADRGRIRLARKEFDEAYRLLDSALARTRAIGERSEEASVLSGLGAAASGMGDHDTALRYLAQGITMAREVGNPNYIARGQIKLANALRRAGAVRDAVTMATELATSLRGTPARENLATVLNVLGAAHLATGDEARSHAAHTEALALASGLEFRIEQAHALAGLGHSAEAQAHYQEMGVSRLFE